VGLDGAERAAERGRDRGFGLVGDEPQHDDLTLAAGEREQRAVQVDAFVVARPILVTRRDIGVDVTLRRVLPSSCVDGEVARDLRDPCFGADEAADPVPARVGPGARLLGEIGRLLTAAEQPERDPVRAAVQRGYSSSKLVSTALASASGTVPSTADFVIMLVSRTALAKG
jgi:hypothetical protein